MVTVLIATLSTAAVFAPIVMGLNLVMRVSQVANFGAGFLCVLAAETCLRWSSRNPALGAVGTVLLGAAIGVATYCLAVLPASRRGVGPVGLAMSTLGFGLVANWVARKTMGTSPSTLAPWLHGEVDLFGTTFANQRWLIVAISAVLMVVVAVMFDYTAIGRAMEGIAHDPELARFYGLRNARYVVLTWLIAGATTALGGIFQASIASVSQDSALPLLAFAFIGAVVGGLGSITGSVVGSLVVAFVQTITTQYVSENLQVTSVFVLLFVVLLLRPQGILGNKAVVRV